MLRLFLSRFASVSALACGSNAARRLVRVPSASSTSVAETRTSTFCLRARAIASFNVNRRGASCPLASATAIAARNRKKVRSAVIFRLRVTMILRHGRTVHPPDYSGRHLGGPESTNSRCACRYASRSKPRSSPNMRTHTMARTVGAARICGKLRIPVAWNSPEACRGQSRARTLRCRD